MTKVNVVDVKARLSEYLDQVERGGRVVICRRNHPVAELVPVAAARTTPRPIGGAKNLVVPPSFFEALPDEVVDSFYPAADTGAPSRAAASKPRYGKRSRKP
jgi:prevent-host-death family protein